MAKKNRQKITVQIRLLKRRGLKAILKKSGLKGNLFARSVKYSSPSFHLCLKGIRPIPKSLIQKIAKAYPKEFERFSTEVPLFTRKGLKIRIRESGLSLNKLAAITGITKGMLSHMAVGRRNITPKMTKRILKGFPEWA